MQVAELVVGQNTSNAVIVCLRCTPLMGSRYEEAEEDGMVEMEGGEEDISAYGDELYEEEAGEMMGMGGMMVMASQ